MAITVKSSGRSDFSRAAWATASASAWGASALCSTSWLFIQPMPPAYVLSAGTGAALGYVLGLSSPTPAAYLGAVLAVVLLRLLGGAARYRDRCV